MSFCHQNTKRKIAIVILLLAIFPFIALAQAPPPPPPPPGEGSNNGGTADAEAQIISELNAFKSKLQSLKQKFNSLQQDAATVLRPVYLVYGHTFVPNVSGNKIDIDINNFTKEKYSSFTKLYEKFLSEKYPDLKENFIGVLGEEVAVLFVISFVDMIQDAIGYYLKAINIDLTKSAQEVKDNAKCFLEKINNVPVDIKQSSDMFKKVDFGLSVFRCLMGFLKGLSDFRDVNAWFESIGITFDRYFDKDALSQTVAVLSSGGNFDSPSNYPKELHGLIEPARHLIEIANLADTLAKLKNFAGNVIYNFLANLLNSSGNDDVKTAIALFPVAMENIYNHYAAFVSGLKQATTLRDLNVGYKNLGEQGNNLNYEFNAGIDSYCKWQIIQGGDLKEYEKCTFTSLINKSGQVEYKTWALGSLLFAQGTFDSGQEKNASPPLGGNVGGSNNGEKIFDENCSVSCSSGMCLRDQNGKLLECVQETRIDENCLTTICSSGRCLKDQDGKFLKCMPERIFNDCSIYYNPDNICTPALLACCSDFGKKCVSGKCVSMGSDILPPVLTDPCLSPENISKCDLKTEKCVDDGKGNAICVPKDSETGGGDGKKKNFCSSMPEPKEGEIIIPNPLCDSTLLELIRRIGTFLQWLAIILAPAIFIIAGIMYLISGGNPERVKTASKMMLWAAIGFVIILLSFGLVNVIMDLIGYR